MFAWFDSRSALIYAKVIADNVEMAMPLRTERGKVFATSKRKEKLEKLLDKVSKGRAYRFNIYQKAKFGTALKGNLRERGYSHDAVDEVVRLVLTRLV
jgi:hypothetical protein